MILASTFMNCGGMTFPYEIANLTRIIYTTLQIIIPLGIIILGSVDILKAVIASDESDMKKKQQKFVSRLISGTIVFLVLSVTHFLIDIAGNNSEQKSFTKCLQCLTVSEEGCTKIIPIEEDNDLPQGEEYGKE